MDTNQKELDLDFWVLEFQERIMRLPLNIQKCKQYLRLFQDGIISNGEYKGKDINAISNCVEVDGDLYDIVRFSDVRLDICHIKDYLKQARKGKLFPPRLNSTLSELIRKATICENFYRMRKDFSQSYPQNVKNIEEYIARVTVFFFGVDNLLLTIRTEYPQYKYNSVRIEIPYIKVYEDLSARKAEEKELTENILNRGLGYVYNAERNFMVCLESTLAYDPEKDEPKAILASLSNLKKAYTDLAMATLTKLKGYEL